MRIVEFGSAGLSPSQGEKVDGTSESTEIRCVTAPSRGNDGDISGSEESTRPEVTGPWGSVCDMEEPASYVAPVDNPSTTSSATSSTPHSDRPLATFPLRFGTSPYGQQISRLAQLRSSGLWSASEQDRHRYL